MYLQLKCIYIVQIIITSHKGNVQYVSQQSRHVQMPPEVESASMSGLTEFRISQTFRGETFEVMLAEWKWRVLPFWTWTHDFRRMFRKHLRSPNPAIFPERSIQTPLDARSTIYVLARYVFTHIVDVNNLYKAIQKYPRGLSVSIGIENKNNNVVDLENYVNLALFSVTILVFKNLEIRESESCRSHKSKSCWSHKSMFSNSMKLRLLHLCALKSFKESTILYF